MRALLALIVVIMTLGGCHSEDAEREPKWIVYALVTAPDKISGTVQAFPYWTEDPQHKVQVEAETPVQRCRVGSVSKSIDHMGSPAVTVAIDSRDAAQFETFTEAHVHRKLAIIVEGRVVSVADISERLPPIIQLQGGFDDAQCEQLMKALR